MTDIEYHEEFAALSITELGEDALWIAPSHTYEGDLTLILQDGETQSTLSIFLTYQGAKAAVTYLNAYVEAVEQVKADNEAAEDGE